MERELKFLSFWSINDKLNIERICGQLDEMKKVGYDGCIWHMRFYPYKKNYLSPEYMDIVSEAILYAKKIGLDFWLYDENGWPSGHCSGKVKKAMPKCRVHWIEPKGNNGYKIKSKKSVNINDSECMKIFVDLTYEGYKKGLKPEAFEYVKGFFSDEVGFLEGHGVFKKKGSIPWAPWISEKYKALYGEDPEKNFYKLFNDAEDAEDFRLKYWRTLTDDLAQNFYKRISDWCEENGKVYTAHLKAEENPYFQIPYSGSPFATLKQITVPAVDALERYKSSNYFPRIASSVAKQFQSGHALTEAIGGSGFGLTPIDFTNYIDWLASCGHSTFVLHICQYSHKSSAICDWPPDLPFTETWKDAFPSLIKELKDKYNGKDLHNDTVVVVPTAGTIRKYTQTGPVGCNGHNGITKSDAEPNAARDISDRFIGQIERYYTYNADFDVTDEEMLEKYATFDENGVTIGKEHYSNIIYSSDCYFDDSEVEAKVRALGTSLDEILLGKTEEEMVNEYVPGLGLNDKLRGVEQVRRRYLGWDKDNADRYDWKVTDAETNCIQLNRDPYHNRFKKSIFRVAEGAQIGEVELKFSDPVKGLKINGKSCVAEGAFDTFTVKFTPKEGLNVIKYRCAKREKAKRRAIPFAFLSGKFLVKSDSVFTQHEDGRQLSTEGGFYLDKWELGMSAEKLVENGFPFMHGKVTAEAEIEFGGSLKLEGLRADAAELFIDGKSYGFQYANSSVVECPDVENGVHKVELKLYPSTFNKYGPHHRFDGDRHICPPSHFYKENSIFADWEDAPEICADEGWRFVKFGI